MAMPEDVEAAIGRAKEIFKRQVSTRIIAAGGQMIAALEFVRDVNDKKTSCPSVR